MEYADYLCRTMDNGEYYVKSLIYGRNIAASTHGPTVRNKVYTASMIMKVVAAAVLVYILIRSGDVELNPGPGHYDDLDYDDVDGSTELSIDNYGQVSKEIATLKAKYYELGTLLGLPTPELNAIERENVRDITRAFRQVIQLWLTGRGHRERTWRKLVEAVDHPAGGRDHVLAKRIAQGHQLDALIISNTAESVTDGARSCISTAATNQAEASHLQNSSDEEEQAGCFPCRRFKRFPCRRFRRGRRTHSRDTYQMKPVIQIEEQPISEDVIDSHPLLNENVTPSLQKCRNTLASSYNMFLDEYAWPPVKTSTYIDLALSEDKKTWRRPVEGAMDSIISEDNIMYPSRLLSLLEDDLRNKSRFRTHNYKLYLLQGRPGCGKTTLITILSRDWANGKLLQSRLLFRVSLRQYKETKCHNLTTLIQHAFQVSELVGHDMTELIQFVQRDNGKNVVFALDGLDEYSTQQSPNEDMIFRLIKGRFLPQAVVIVTSRPAACTNFRRYATREIEVLGFFQEQCNQYMLSHVEGAKGQQLIDHLEQHPSLMNMCYLPLHCAMFVFFFDEINILPTTETEFYEHYTRSTILRAINRQDDAVIQLPDFEQLPSRFKDLFDKICNLAFEGVIHSKYVFKQAEIHRLKSIFEEDSRRTGNDESSLGLIVIDRYFMRNGLDETYTFLHRTHQEYLAAVHIAQSREKLMEIVTAHRQKKNLSVVWRFLCGMLDYSISDSMIVFQTLTRSGDSLFKIRCAYESQHFQPCRHVVHSLEKEKVITFAASGVTFSPSDFIALEDVVSKTNSGLGGDERKIEINCLQCILSVTGATMLLTHVGKHPFSLELSKGDEAVKSFLEAFKQHPTPNLRQLQLSENNIGPEGAHALGEGFGLLSTSILTALSLSFNGIGDIGLQELQNGLKQCTGLKRLHLDNNKIGDLGAQTLAEGVQYWDNLKELTLSTNKIGDVGAQRLIDSLKQKHYNVLCTLGLYNNCLTSSNLTLQRLTYMIQNFTKLRVLEVGGHKFSEDNKKTLREAARMRKSDHLMNQLELAFAG